MALGEWQGALGEWQGALGEWQGALGEWRSVRRTSPLGAANLRLSSAQKIQNRGFGQNSLRNAVPRRSSALFGGLRRL